MPRQNRVDPFGNIVAHPSRGMLMGNRGCLHDETGTIVRETDRDAWISCLPHWPGVRRQLMAPEAYTELFFLDEPTALAAGHRPCGECRPDALRAFKQAWATAFGLRKLPKVAEIDGRLREDQLLASATVCVTSLPDGTLAQRDGSTDPWLLWRGHCWHWSFDGYRARQAMDEEQVTPITLPSMMGVLRHGYVPAVIGDLIATSPCPAAAASDLCGQ